MVSRLPPARAFRARTLAGRGRHALGLLLAAAALVALATPTGARAAGSQARVTDALTGRSDASQLTAQSVCAPATTTRVTCYAEMLVNRAGRTPVHPRLATPATTATTATTARAGHRFAAARAASRGVPEPQPGTPAYLQQVYDLSYLSQNGGAGDTVAIVDAYDNPNAEADLATYRAVFGLPPCTTQNGCFRKVDEHGGQAYPSQGPGWTSEISLDLDAVSAVCPRCHIVLVEANSDNYSDLLVAEAEAAALGANQITDSWGAPTSFVPGGQYTFPGVATVAAAGDGGYLGGLVNQYPAALPGVTAAGGTSIVPAATSGVDNARGFTEQAWSNSGSGCDLQVSKPSWQTDGGCTGRSYNDLSANADPNSGIDVYDSADGGWLLMGGTSESAPLIAAYYAITGASAASPAWAYQHAGQLNDPVGQSTGNCPGSMLYICVAGAGYSGPAGAGSISGAVTDGGPGIGGPGTHGTYTSSTTGTSAQLRAGIYPNGADTTYSWQYGTTAAYGQSSATGDAGSGPAPTFVSSTLSGLVPGTTYHYRLVAQNAFGTSYGYDFTFRTNRPGRPIVSTVRAIATGGRAATLIATVHLPAGTATYQFVYGSGHSYGHRTATVSVSGGAAKPITARITGLSPHKVYRVKVVVRSAGGVAASPVTAFSTSRAARHHGRRHARKQ